MNKSFVMKQQLDSLLIYDFQNDPLIAAMYEMFSCEGKGNIIRHIANVFSKAAETGSLNKHIANLVKENDNIFTKSVCAGRENELSKEVLDAVQHDLNVLEQVGQITKDDIVKDIEDEECRRIAEEMPEWNCGEKEFPFSISKEARIQKLAEYHRKNGYGVFAVYRAFQYKKGALTGITSPSPIRLTDLKNYDLQRQQVIENTKHFIENLPANNVLLYGDRGTGKSSTVHAVLNEFYTLGLRMIEISKNEICNLSELREIIADSPMKFIVFIDDLTFEDNDASFGELKAALEGSLSGKIDNMVIYATSNRRHLIKEKFSDRENEISRNDVLQEQLSLSDRFGLVITFINPDKKGYLDIVEKIAEDRGLNIDTDELFLLAEQWASRKGGRSPRGAKQLVDYLESRQKSHSE